MTKIKKIISVMTFMLIFLTSSFAQNASDTLRVETGNGAVKIYQGDQFLTLTHMLKVMETNVEAHAELKKSKSNKAFATIIGCVGGFMVGYPIGTAIGGGKPNWALAGAGAALFVVSLPISIKSNKQLLHSIELYNSGLRSTSYNSSELKFTLSANGPGIVLRF